MSLVTLLGLKTLDGSWIKPKSGSFPYLFMALDSLIPIPKRVVAVPKIPQSPSLVQNSRGRGQLFQRGQLLLQIADGVLVVAHVEPPYAQVAERARLHTRVLGIESFIYKFIYPYK